LDKARWHKLYAERIKEAERKSQFIDDSLGKRLKAA